VWGASIEKTRWGAIAAVEEAISSSVTPCDLRQRSMVGVAGVVWMVPC
jgi:hypothetical protein